MAWKDKSIKERLLNTLAYFWANIIPLLIVISFFVGVCFNLWKVQGVSLILSVIISIVLGALTAFGLGKLLKKW